MVCLYLLHNAVTCFAGLGFDGALIIKCIVIFMAIFIGYRHAVAGRFVAIASDLRKGYFIVLSRKR